MLMRRHQLDRFDGLPRFLLTQRETLQRVRDQLAEQLRLVHSQLDIASGRADSEQRIIADQQRLIEAGKRGLKGIAESLAGSGGDIGKQVHALAEGFVRLYRIYHPGSG